MSDGPVLILGTVHTGFLQNSTALPPARCGELLALSRGDRVSRLERPIAHAVSPATLTGVDCGLAGSARQARAIGTVACRASITGGHILQAASTAWVTRSRTGHRQPWSHYLATPGQLELIGGATGTDLAARFVGGPPVATALDLDAISTRLVDAVQASPELDRRAPVRAARTRLRWAAAVSADAPPAVLRLRIEDGGLRTALLSCRPADIAGVVEFCADLALHDWLLGTVLRIVARTAVGTASRSEVVRALRPAADHLLHLWMPAARGGDVPAALWSALEHRPGLDRQWRATVYRIRDQLTMGAISLLETALGGSPL
jgi:hypothetical protein